MSSNKSQALPDAQNEKDETEELEDWELSDISPQYLLKRNELMTNTTSQNTTKVYNTEDSGAEWDDCNLVHDAKLPAITPVASKDRESVILILVDLTVLSSGKIHNKFDKFSVNDQDAKKIMCERSHRTIRIMQTTLNLLWSRRFVTAAIQCGEKHLKLCEMSIKDITGFPFSLRKKKPDLNIENELFNLDNYRTIERIIRNSVIDIYSSSFGKLLCVKCNLL